MILYIDPGTGSMLFSLFIGLAVALTFALKKAILKLKFFISGGRFKADDSNKLNLVIFSDHKRYWNVFKPICQEAEKRGLELTYLTMSEDDPVFTSGLKNVHAEFLGNGNKGYGRLNMLKAHIVLSTTPGLDVYQWKRSPDVDYYVHIPHVVSDLSDYRMFGLDYYDAVLTTGNNQIETIRKLESLRGIKPKTLINTGCTYMDGLKARRTTSLKNEKPVVLVAPSWGSSSILNKYGSSFLENLRKTPFKIIVRPHPQSLVSEKDMLNKLMEEFKDFEWNFDNDNFEVLSRADVLISDFSGVMFDFSLVFNKPIIYTDTQFNTLPYDADWLEEPMWSLRVLPRLGLRLTEDNFNKIEELVNDAIKNPSLDKHREEVRNECWSNIGSSASVIVDKIQELKHKADNHFPQDVDVTQASGA